MGFVFATTFVLATLWCRLFRLLLGVLPHTKPSPRPAKPRYLRASRITHISTNINATKTKMHPRDAAGPKGGFLVCFAGYRVVVGCLRRLQVSKSWRWKLYLILPRSKRNKRHRRCDFSCELLFLGWSSVPQSIFSFLREGSIDAQQCLKSEQCDQPAQFLLVWLC